MAVETKTLMAADELARLPDDGLRRELVRGEVTEMAPAGHEHSVIASRIGMYLWQAALASRAGDVSGEQGGFILERDPDTVRAPDVAFVLKARLPGGRRPKGFFPGCPDLAVEVVSPDDRPQEVEAKVEDYLQAGTALVWVVYPDLRRVRVYRAPSETFVAGGNGVLNGDPVLPGLAVRVADIFD